MNWRSKWLANVISPSLLQPPVFRAEQRSISIWTQEKWQVAGFSFGCNVDIGLRNLVCLTFHARPSHRLAIVRAAENHFRAVNDNHDIANRRIPITPDLDFRRSVFAGHRNIFLCSKAGSISPSPSATGHLGGKSERTRGYAGNGAPRPMFPWR